MVRLPENQLLDVQIPSGELQGSAAPSLLTFSLTPKAAGRWFESSRGRFSRDLSFQPKSLDASGFPSRFRLRNASFPRSSPAPPWWSTTSGTATAVCSARWTERPRRTLVAFERLELSAGEQRPLTLVIPLRRLACFDEQRDGFVIEPGLHRLVMAAHVDAAGPAAELLLEERDLGP